MSQDNFSAENIGDTVRLFPLPNLVLFPHVAQPLHIFEQRYRQLMADALADDRRITMALLQPGWEEDYHRAPAIHPMVCIGRILQEEPQDDGRYNLLLQGITRARIIEEIPTQRLYRTARVEICSDRTITSAQLEQTLRHNLGQQVLPFFSAHAQAAEQLRGLLASPLSLGALCDIFSFALPLDVEVKQTLLEECDVQLRVERLLASLEGNRPPGGEPTPRRFPPEFSSN